MALFSVRRMVPFQLVSGRTGHIALLAALLIALLFAFGIVLFFFLTSMIGETAIERLLPQLAERFSAKIQVGKVRVRGTRIELLGLHLSSPQIVANIERVEARVDLASLLTLRPEIAEVTVRGGSIHGNAALLLQKPPQKTTTLGASRLLSPRRISADDLRVEVHLSLVDLLVQRLSFSAERGKKGNLDLHGIQVTLQKEIRGFAGPKGGRFQVGRVRLDVPLAQSSYRPHQLPRELQIYDALLILHEQALFRPLSGTLKIPASDVLYLALAQPEQAGQKEARLSALVSLRKRGERKDLDLDVDVRGLSLFHPKLAQAPLHNVAFAVSLSAFSEPNHLGITGGLVRMGPLRADLRFDLRLSPQDKVQELTLDLRVPPIPCMDALLALPQDLIPSLNGFVLRGQLQAGLHVYLDLPRLLAKDPPLRSQGDPLQIEWDFDRRACQVIQAPWERSAERLARPFLHKQAVAGLAIFVGHIPMGGGSYTPLAEISPYAQGAILTTEDHSFFWHHGFSTDELKEALQENLARGRIHTGASTITMQMVKNVLLSQERTVSRKIQELVLSWYLEDHLSKSRILEIYLNVIEFGPGIYGIGPAARHYFGKRPLDLTPRQSAWLAALLPSPKKTYQEFCNGKLSEQWEGRLSHILTRMYRLQRLTEPEFLEAVSQRLGFRRLKEMPLGCLRGSGVRPARAAMRGSCHPPDSCR